MFDQNGDGLISIEEIKSLLGASKVQTSINEEEWEDLIREVDINGDGKIDFDEFLEMMKSQGHI